MACIELAGVSKRFGSTRAVDDLTLSVERGEIVALLGPSGSGKTTALRLIAGFERPDDGRIAVDGQLVAAAGRERSARSWLPPERRRIGMVFQDLALFPHLTVAGNAAFGLRGMDRAARQRRLGEVLELVELTDLADRYPHQLSGGQQQRVALGRALAASPEVVLLDEPFSNLDADLRDRVREDVRRILRRARATAVLVTHDQDEALGLADRVAIMHAGRLEQFDRPLGVYHTPATRFVADFLGLADFLTGRVEPHGIHTEVGLLPNPGLPAGEAEVMVRPTDVYLTPGPHGQAVVTARRFRGPDNYYALRLDSGAVLHSVRPATEIYGLDTRVRVTIQPLQLVVFRAGRSVAAACLVAGCLCGARVGQRSAAGLAV